MYVETLGTPFFHCPECHTYQANLNKNSSLFIIDVWRLTANIIHNKIKIKRRFLDSRWKFLLYLYHNTSKMNKDLLELFIK
jgi:hypothetical protein